MGREQLLARLGIAESMAAQAKATAHKIAEGAGRLADTHTAEIERRGEEIRQRGVGADEESEREYCRMLMARHRLIQTHALSMRDAGRMGDAAGPALEKALRRAKAPEGQLSLEWDDDSHPRAPAGGSGKYEGGQFIPKDESGASGDAKPSPTLENPTESGDLAGTKAVDAQGRPLVLYHGSSEKFAAFDPSKLRAESNDGMGFYFTPSHQAALEYSQQQDPATGEIIGQGSLHTCHLRIVRPLDVEERLTKKEWQQIRAALPKGGLLAKLPETRTYFDSHFRWGRPPARALFHYFFNTILDREERKKAAGEMQAALRTLGYDGVVSGRDGEERHWVAWDPSQIIPVEAAPAPADLISSHDAADLADARAFGAKTGAERITFKSADNRHRAQMDSEDYTGIGFGEEEHRRLAEFGPLSILHNHPLATPFSYNDLKTFASFPNFQKAHVVLPDGEIHSLLPGNTPFTTETADAINSAMPETLLNVRDELGEGASKQEVKTEAMRRLATQHGLRFYITKPDPSKPAASEQEPSEPLDLEAFGLRDFRAGSKVKKGVVKKCRAELARALQDLSEATGLPPEAVGLSGNLTVTVHENLGPTIYGQYLRKYRNLLLRNDPADQAVAHEWWHAVDHSFAIAVHGEDTESFGSEMVADDRVFAPYRALVQTVQGCEQFMAQAKAMDTGRSLPYFTEPSEYTARAFETYLQDKLQGREWNTFLLTGEQNYRTDPRNTRYPQGEERERINRAFDALFAAIQQNPALMKALAREWVPPDVPRWGKKPSGEEQRFLPLNGVEDRDKFRQMVDDMQSGKWKWNVPVVRAGDQLLTGSHRYHAAKEAGLAIPTITLDELFRQCGLDLREVWKEEALPYSGHLNNLRLAVFRLPEAVRDHFGLDLG